MTTTNESMREWAAEWQTQRRAMIRLSNQMKLELHRQPTLTAEIRSAQDHLAASLAALESVARKAARL